MDNNNEPTSNERIKVAYVNEPKSPKGPGSVKTPDGRYFKVWRDNLSKFAVGGEYEVGLTEEQYNGKTQFTVRTVKPANGSAPSSGAAPASNGNGYAGRSPEVQARIERQHSQHMFLLYCKVKGAVPGTTEEIRAGIDWWQRDIAHAPGTPTAATTAPMPEAAEQDDPGLDLK